MRPAFWWKAFLGCKGVLLGCRRVLLGCNGVLIGCIGVLLGCIGTPLIGQLELLFGIIIDVEGLFVCICCILVDGM